MDRQPWLERVADELAGRGLPARARARLLEELRDHLEDLTEGGAKMATATDLGQQMGPPEDIASVAAMEYRRSSWVRRHPRLVFGLAPLPTAILGLAVYMLVAVGIAAGLTAAGYGEPESLIARHRLESVAAVYWYSLAFVPFVSVAGVFGWLAMRSQVAGRWVIVALLQVALLGGMATTQVRWSDIPGQSQLLLGVGIPLTGWRQAAQLILPLAVGWLTLRASRRRAIVA